MSRPRTSRKWIRTRRTAPAAARPGPPAAPVEGSNMVWQASRRVRRGYTLMEVTVALAVAMLLLGGLYYAFTIVIGQTNAARDLVSETEEARGVFNRLNDD